MRTRCQLQPWLGSHAYHAGAAGTSRATAPCQHRLDSDRERIGKEGRRQPNLKADLEGRRCLHTYPCGDPCGVRQRARQRSSAQHQVPWRAEQRRTCHRSSSKPKTGASPQHQLRSLPAIKRYRTARWRQCGGAHHPPVGRTNSRMSLANDSSTFVRSYFPTRSDTKNATAAP